MNIADFQQPEDILGALQQPRIAVVGLSPKPHRDSNEVARYLLANGYQVVPVNPQEQEILGLRCYPSLAEIPEPVDVVDVFRAADAVPAVATAAVVCKAKYLWLQLGVIHEAAASMAQLAGVAVIMDRCIKVDHARLRSQLG